MIDEQPSRARTITLTNTGALAAAAWLVDRGIMPDQPRWFVELTLDCESAPGETWFQLDVYAEEWGFQMHHRGRVSWIRVTDVAFVHGRDDHQLLARVPRLREIGLFITELERMFQVEFARDAPRIQTSIDGARRPLLDWVAAL